MECCELSYRFRIFVTISWECPHVVIIKKIEIAMTAKTRTFTRLPYNAFWTCIFERCRTRWTLSIIFTGTFSTVMINQFLVIIIFLTGETLWIFLFAFLYYFCTFWVDGFFSFDRQFKNICILEMLALYTLPTVRSLHGGKHFWHCLPHGSVSGSVSGFVSGSVCGCDSVIKSGQFNNNKHRLRQSYIL